MVDMLEWEHQEHADGTPPRVLVVLGPPVMPLTSAGRELEAGPRRRRAGSSSGSQPLFWCPGTAGTQGWASHRSRSQLSVRSMKWASFGNSQLSVPGGVQIRVRVQLLMVVLRIIITGNEKTCVI